MWNENLALTCVTEVMVGGEFDISQQKSNLKANDGKARLYSIIQGNRDKTHNKMIFKKYMRQCNMSHQ